MNGRKSGCKSGDIESVEQARAGVGLFFVCGSRGLAGLPARCHL